MTDITNNLRLECPKHSLQIHSYYGIFVLVTAAFVPLARLTKGPQLFRQTGHFLLVRPRFSLLPLGGSTELLGVQVLQRSEFMLVLINTTGQLLLEVLRQTDRQRRVSNNYTRGPQLHFPNNCPSSLVSLAQ